LSRLCLKASRNASSVRTRFTRGLHYGTVSNAVSPSISDASNGGSPSSTRLSSRTLQRIKKRRRRITSAATGTWLRSVRLMKTRRKKKNPRPRRCLRSTRGPVPIATMRMPSISCLSTSASAVDGRSQTTTLWFYLIHVESTVTVRRTRRARMATAKLSAILVRVHPATLVSQ